MRADLAQWCQPDIQQVGQQGDVNLFLVLEIIEQVRLRHLGCGGDPVERCAAKAVFRKHLQRGQQDPGFVFLLDPCL